MKLTQEDFLFEKLAGRARTPARNADGKFVLNPFRGGMPVVMRDMTFEEWLFVQEQRASTKESVCKALNWRDEE